MAAAGRGRVSSPRYDNTVSTHNLEEEELRRCWQLEIVILLQTAEQQSTWEPLQPTNFYPDNLLPKNWEKIYLSWLKLI